MLFAAFMSIIPEANFILALQYVLCLSLESRSPWGQSLKQRFVCTRFIWHVITGSKSKGPESIKQERRKNYCKDILSSHSLLGTAEAWSPRAWRRMVEIISELSAKWLDRKRHLSITCWPRWPQEVITPLTSGPCVVASLVVAHSVGAAAPGRQQKVLRACWR